MRKVVSLVVALMVAVPFLAVAEGCSSTSASAKKSKASAAKTPATAQTSKDKAGGTATGAQAKATPKTQEDGVACDASFEGAAFCSSDTTVVFCTQGSWYELSCPALAIGADVCAADGVTVDCYAASEVE